MIQIRHVPSALHLKLKARAAKANKSLSDYLLDEIERMADRPTMEEWVERLRSRRPVNSGLSSAEVIRQARDQR